MSGLAPGSPTRPRPRADGEGRAATARSPAGAGGLGGAGVVLGAGGVLTNDGKVKGGSGGAGGAGPTAGATGVMGGGVVASVGGTIVNNAGAVISGDIGVKAGASGAVSVTNYGKIKGLGGTAVTFKSAADVLIAEAGSSFAGQVLGGGGTLELFSSAGGNGTVGGLGGAGYASGAVTANFSGFATYAIGGAGVWTLAGANTLAAGQTLKIQGVVQAGAGATLDNAGVVKVTSALVLGALTNDGKVKVAGGGVEVQGDVSGSGKVKINAGAFQADAAFSQNVAFTGTSGQLVLADSQAYAGTISGFSLVGGTSLDLEDIGFVSPTEALFSGTASGGTLTVSDGIHTAKITLAGDYLSSTFIASSDGSGGTVVVDPQATAFAGAMAAMRSAAPGPASHYVDPRAARPPALFAANSHA